MTDQKWDSAPASQSWDAYWRGARLGHAAGTDGCRHTAVLSFWDEFFKGARSQYGTPRIIDIASGSGAVLERAMSAFAGQPADFSCLDVSASAVAMIQRRYHAIHGIVCDARSIPLESGGYDIATSQFGVEYAGLDSVDEVARLISRGGRLAFLLHYHAGEIYRQCAASVAAIERMRRARFISCSIAMLEEGFAACRGANRAGYEAAARQFVPALRAMESILTQYGANVAGGTIMQLYEYVGRIHRRIQHYEPSEVLGWLRRLDEEMPAYSARMSSMCEVAIDAEGYEQLCGRLRKQGYAMLQCGPLEGSDRDRPLAWILVAAKS